MEIYGEQPINPIDIPEWHVSMKAPLRDAIDPPDYVDAEYNGLEIPDEVHNTDISYQADENAVHMRVGGTTTRQTIQTGAYNRYQLPPVE